MENRRNSKNIPATRSNNVAPVRKNGNSVKANNLAGGLPAMRNSSQNTSVGIHKTGSGLPAGKPVPKNAPRNGNSVVGMSPRKPSTMRAVRNPKIITIRKKERTPFPISIIFTSIIITTLFIFMMMNYAELDKYNNETAKNEAMLTQLKEQQRELSIKLDKKDNPIIIEKYAKENLGMVKKETLPYDTVNLQPADKTEVIKYEDGNEEGFGFMLAGIGEVLSDFLK